MDTSRNEYHEDDEQQLHPNQRRTSTQPKKHKNDQIPNVKQIPIDQTLRTGIAQTTIQTSSEISLAARSFATTRYPFAPFHVIFKSAIKDRSAIDEIVKHAKNEHKFDLKIAAYRHKLSENGYSLLVFVENIEAFCFLNKDLSWPSLLAEAEYTIKKPSIPPQLCLIVLNVSLNTDWEEFVDDVKERYPDVVNVIRLKNRNQRPVPTVKIETSCATTRESILQLKQMNIGYINYKVTEYLAPAQVLLCGNCYEIGHFQKNCPLKDETICKTCGEKYRDIKEHECSGQAKCIRCGENHKSSDPKCQMVKSYRAALTRNLLQHPVENSKRYANDISPVEYPLAFAKQQLPVNSIKPNYPIEALIESTLTKKLDAFLNEIKSEIKKTHESIDVIREEMHAHLVESNKKIEAVEKQVKNIDHEVREQVTTLNNTIEAIMQTLNDISNLSPEHKASIAPFIKKTRQNSKASKSKQ
ncbi:unnamed protein product [Adineta ricciae]|uniref:CCHC-type domain-containing protein n=1 Tax=Adineta ricciae TaxID=249248 RepID=A0A815VRP8_ADIRI|nr:unnamed protein product [Adineta ricciae]CAF1533897.1 unnamed protein product [Adineta ricciae]